MVEVLQRAQQQGERPKPLSAAVVRLAREGSIDPCPGAVVAGTPAGERAFTGHVLREIDPEPAAAAGIR